MKGHDFSRAVNAAKSTWALAPEEMLGVKSNLFRGSLAATTEKKATAHLQLITRHCALEANFHAGLGT